MIRLSGAYSVILDHIVIARALISAAENVSISISFLNLDKFFIPFDEAISGLNILHLYIFL